MDTCFSKRATKPPSLDIHSRWMFFLLANLKLCGKAGGGDIVYSKTMAAFACRCHRSLSSVPNPFRTGL